MYIKGNARVVIEGDNNVTIEGHCNVEIDGDVNQTVHGDWNLDVAGEFNVNSGSGIRVRGSSIKAEAFLDSVNVYGRKHLNLQGRENITLHANTGLVGMYAKTDIRQRADNDMYVAAGNDFWHDVGGDYAFEAVGTINIGTDDEAQVESAPAGRKSAFRTLFDQAPERRMIFAKTFDKPTYPLFTDPLPRDEDTHTFDIAVSIAG